MSYAWKRLDRAELAWMDADVPALAELGGWRCADCGQSSHTASIADPCRCSRCAQLRYRGWRRVVFGNLRKVPPREAARWEP